MEWIQEALFTDENLRAANIFLHDSNCPGCLAEDTEVAEDDV